MRHGANIDETVMNIDESNGSKDEFSVSLQVAPVASSAPNPSEDEINKKYLPFLDCQSWATMDCRSKGCGDKCIDERFEEEFTLSMLKNTDEELKHSAHVTTFKGK